MIQASTTLSRSCLASYYSHSASGRSERPSIGELWSELTMKDRSLTLRASVPSSASCEDRSWTLESLLRGNADCPAESATWTDYSYCA